MPSSVRRAVARWNQMLERGDAARETHEALVEGVRRHGLVYGDRPITSFLRPRFVDAATWQQAESVGRVFHRSLERLMRDLRQDAASLQALGIEGRLQKLVRMPQRGADDLWFARLDGFLDRGLIRLVEFNVDSPGGAAFLDGIAEVYAGLDVFRRFRAATPLRRRASIPGMRRCVLGAARRLGMDRPRVAIVDWTDVATSREFLLIRDDFERHGIPTVIADPRELTVARERAVAGGGPVDLILKRVLVTDMAERWDETAALRRIIREGLATCLNPPACQAVTTKTLLALFHEGRLDRSLSPAARAAWRRHVPWTVRVREGRVPRGARAVDLMRYLDAHRERLVLKPSEAYGAEGVVLGWHCGAAEWTEHLETALRHGGYVAQERVRIPTEEYPEMADGALAWRRLHVEMSPYTFGAGITSECLSRLSRSDFLNVKAGGGVVATFVVEG